MISFHSKELCVNSIVVCDNDDSRLQWIYIVHKQENIAS